MHKIDPWLLDEANPIMTINNPTLINENMTSLMVVGRHEWDEDVIWDVCNERDSRLIVSIPLNFASYEDQWLGQGKNRRIYGKKLFIAIFKKVRHSLNSWMIIQVFGKNYGN